MPFIKFYKNFAAGLNNLESVVLLAIRLVLAYGFYAPATKKFGDISSIAAWFETLGIPLPHLSAYLAASTEMLGVVCLTVGIFTRFISIPLMFTMIVAIATVHWQNGFHAGDNGFEIPLYYLIMLALLLAKGPGKLSADAVAFEN